MELVAPEFEERAATFAPDPDARPPRYVNVCFARSVNDEPMPKALTLQIDRIYYIRVNIGALSPSSIVTNPTLYPFPDSRLPVLDADGHWLEASRRLAHMHPIGPGRLSLGPGPGA
jgi:hypothetical protein